jgi:UDP-N-acetylglucosamine transferase subunit ALG13
MTTYSPRALFAISSLGLGHASRTLAVLRAFLRRGYLVTVISTGGALSYLRDELADEAAVTFHEMVDYPPLERGQGWGFYWFLLADLIRTWLLIRREHRAIRRRAVDYDVIVSDGRYGIRSRFIPSFIITHQLAFIPPHGLGAFFWLTKHLNLLALRSFDAVLIPDFPDPRYNLSGRLAHSVSPLTIRHHYIGILSSYERLTPVQDIDYLFIISGYLQEHKDAFIRSLLEQAVTLPGRKVFILGRNEDNTEQLDTYRSPDLQIYGMVSGPRRQELFNRAKTVISRAGYTTVMDLVEHGKKALLIPTPNQTEQEYLAAFLGGRSYFASRPQSAALDLRQALAETETTVPFTAPWRTGKTLQLIEKAIEPLCYHHRFSIIVPAHNEEGHLSATLKALLDQRYPAARYEIIVVENGSSDMTLSIARSLAAAPRTHGRITVLQSPRGVSAAKNAGLRAAHHEAEWVLFCDADTHLGPHLLTHLNTWLNRCGSAVSVGTARIRPHHGATIYATVWFRLFNLVHRLTKTSFSLQFARTTVARQIGFAEDLQLAEDLLFIRGCLRHGRFFYLPTDQVTTSIRRFSANGYLRQSLRWSFEALLPLNLKRKRVYHVVR